MVDKNDEATHPNPPWIKVPSKHHVGHAYWYNTNTKEKHWVKTNKPLPAGASFEESLNAAGGAVRVHNPAQNRLKRLQESLKSKNAKEMKEKVSKCNVSQVRKQKAGTGEAKSLKSIQEAEDQQEAEKPTCSQHQSTTELEMTSVSKGNDKKRVTISGGVSKKGGSRKSHGEKKKESALKSTLKACASTVKGLKDLFTRTDETAAAINKDGTNVTKRLAKTYPQAKLRNKRKAATSKTVKPNDSLASVSKKEEGPIAEDQDSNVSKGTNVINVRGTVNAGASSMTNVVGRRRIAHIPATLSASKTACTSKLTNVISSSKATHVVAGTKTINERDSVASSKVSNAAANSKDTNFAARLRTANVASTSKAANVSARSNAIKKDAITPEAPSSIAACSTPIASTAPLHTFKIPKLDTTDSPCSSSLNFKIPKLDTTDSSCSSHQQNSTTTETSQDIFTQWEKSTSMIDTSPQQPFNTSTATSSPWSYFGFQEPKQPAPMPNANSSNGLFDKIKQICKSTTNFLQSKELKTTPSETTASPRSLKRTFDSANTSSHFSANDRLKRLRQALKEKQANAAGTAFEASKAFNTSNASSNSAASSPSDTNNSFAASNSLGCSVPSTSFGVPEPMDWEPSYETCEFESVTSSTSSPSPSPTPTACSPASTSTHIVSTSQVSFDLDETLGDYYDTVTKNLTRIFAEDRKLRNTIHKDWSYIVVDTNILLDHLLFVKNMLNKLQGELFEVIFIPYNVVKELDKLKINFKSEGVKTRTVRAIRFLNEHVEARNPKLRVQSGRDEQRHLMHVASPDDHIINCCLQLEEAGVKNVVLVSEDVNLRTLAHSCAVRTAKVCDVER